MRCSIIGPQNSYVVIDGAFAGDTHGLRIESAGSSGVRISDLVIINFQRSGIYVAGHAVSGAPTNVIIEYCEIGINPANEAPQGNGAGITILGVNGVVIRNNLVSANKDAGIEVYSNFAMGSYTEGVRITGNNVGGNDFNEHIYELGNGRGIVMGQAPSQFVPGLNVVDCLIGGLQPEDQNWLVGNHGPGITIQGDNFGGPANRVIGNVILNCNLGILLNTCDNVIVATNGIALNSTGIHITSTGNNRASGNILEKNYIEANWSDGIRIDGGSLLTRIGGPGRGNLISANGSGVVIAGASTSRHSILQNEIRYNGLGIDLGDNGVSHNRFLTPGTGPNLSQRSPEFISIQRTNGNTIVRARINSNLNPPFTVEYFWNTQCNPRGFGEGEFLLHQVTVPFSERLDFTVTIPGEHFALTMTSTDNAGNTSEFSTCDMPGVVNSTGDLPDTSPGDGIAWTGQTLQDGRLEVTLRAAMEEAASTNRNFSTILFDIPGAGPHVITPATALPDIVLPTAIDATSQPGYSPGNPVVEVNGTALGQNPLNGFNLLAGDTAIRGLAIVNFGKDGVFIQGRGGNVIEANFIGLRTDGVTLAGASESGIHILNSTNNVIGGLNSAVRNVITGNGKAGTGGANITIEGAGSSNNRVLGNYIGTDKTGAASPANPTAADGVRLFGGASGNVIGGPTIASRNVISGNLQGIQIQGAGTVRNRIEGNIIGLNAAANAAIPNRRNGILISDAKGIRIGGATATPGSPPGNIISGNSFNGIESHTDENRIEGNILGTSPGGSLLVGNVRNGVLLHRQNNLIGGSDVKLRNLISGNHESGILLMGAGARFNQIEANSIGVNAAGMAAIPNRLHGIHIRGGRNNVIGGSPAGLGNLGVAALGNLISGNFLSGILIESPPAEPANVASENLIQGNRIGVNTTGLGALANNAGISLVETPGNLIGGPDPETANLISGNLTDGIHIKGVGSDGNRIHRNTVGLNAPGVLALGNGANGIRLEGARNAFVGGAAPLVGLAPLGNVISGNGGHGILIDGTPGVGQDNAGHRITRNRIGVNGNDAPAGNGGDGIRILAASGNLIGSQNLIAHNSGAGVAVPHAVRGDQNEITANSIFSNGLLGIDLGGDGPTPNDPDDADTGPNRLQNFPELTLYGGVLQAMFVHLRSTPNTPFRIEFYINSSADPSGFGEGETWDDEVLFTTDSQGRARFTMPLPGLGAGECVTAIAINRLTGDTSEFSACATVQSAPLADFGDAPGLQHRTTLAANGARHLVNPAIRLGALIDGESDAVINPLNASGDDADNLNDEDGVEFLGPLRYGTPLSEIRVQASVAGYLNGWIDLNANGDFAQPEEHVIQNVALSAGFNVLQVPIPAAAVPGITYARFRFSTVPGLSFYGPAPDGKVEDYQVTIADSGTTRLETTLVTGGKLRIAWATKLGWKYQMQFKTNLGAPGWEPLVALIVGDGTTMNIEEPAAGNLRFYRLAITPP
ncbi:MAG: right-handed parallel beta-helix repeat-containing protein [Verrucomicrobia bacterium]|nr:right-handed parallel beta-helix repeat-containing protein [Verrucomicrobiota bacterium]